MRWQDPETYQVREINGNFNTWDLTANFESSSPHYRLAVLVAFYAEVLRESPWVRGLSLYEIYNWVTGLTAEIPWDPEVAEFVDLVGRASQINPNPNW